MRFEVFTVGEEGNVVLGSDTQTGCFSKTLVSTYESTQHHNPEEHNHHHKHFCL
jgi:hypothetical protein